jgi:hypothetical protein
MNAIVATRDRRREMGVWCGIGAGTGRGMGRNKRMAMAARQSRCGRMARRGHNGRIARLEALWTDRSVEVTAMNESGKIFCRSLWEGQRLVAWHGTQVQ